MRPVFLIIGLLLGNLTSFRDANNTGYNCVYDARNRKLSCADRAGDSTAQTYDAHGNVISMTDGMGNTSSCSYDTRDRKVSCTDRLGGVTTYTYDLNSNLATIADADANAAHSGLTTAYAYDRRNLLLSETYPDTKTKSFTYDGGNRLVSRTDQKSDVVTYNYDYANRMLSRHYPDSLDDTFSYDPAGRLLTALSNRYTNAVTRTYDPGGRLATETQNIGGVNYPITYGYDSANRQTNVTYPDGKAVVRTFTPRNQLNTLAYDGTNVATRTYDNGMRLFQTVYGNTITETRTYRIDNMPDSITDDAFASYLAYSQGGQFDANKRIVDTYNVITRIDDHYIYDKEDRLSGFTPTAGGLPTESWSLTLAGDWNSFTKDTNTETRTYDGVHAVTARNGNPLSYDLKGNLTDKGINSGLGGDGNTTYVWDFENRLTTAASSGANAATLGTYTYDALGRRATKTASGITTVFISDGLQEIAEYDNGAAVAAPTREHVFGSYIDEPLLMVTSGQKYYYHSDYLYSVQALSDSAGHVIERYKYDPYGNVSIYAPDFTTARTASIVGNPYLWQGGRLDSETGLNYKRARMYDPILGRWISRDPIGYRAGLHLYRYCHNKPTNRVDPLGFEDHDGDAARQEKDPQQGDSVTDDQYDNPMSEEASRKKADKENKPAGAEGGGYGSGGGGGGGGGGSGNSGSNGVGSDGTGSTASNVPTPTPTSGFKPGTGSTASNVPTPTPTSGFKTTGGAGPADGQTSVFAPLNINGKIIESTSQCPGALSRLQSRDRLIILTDNSDPSGALGKGPTLTVSEDGKITQVPNNDTTKPAWQSYEEKNGGAQTPMETTFDGKTIKVRLDAPPTDAQIVDFKDYDWSKPAYDKPFIQEQVAQNFQSQIAKYKTIRDNVNLQFSSMPPQWAIDAILQAGGTYSVKH